MRTWGLPLALLLAAGCGQVHTPPLARVAAMRPPPAAVDPRVLAKRLTAMQRDWPVEPRVDCKKVKCVALTFDDGPGPYTARLLHMLRKYGAKATFFVVGQMVAADRERTLIRIVEDGHELGNHTWSHPDLTAVPGDVLHHQFRRTQDLVERLTGLRMTLMRPPYGSTDGRVAAETRREGLAQILWNVDTLDWLDRSAPIVARRAAQAKPGSIVLMHDIHHTTVDAVPKILDVLAHKGYTFVTVSELYGKPPAPGRKYTER